MNSHFAVLAAGLLFPLLPAAQVAGDAARGAQAARACMACHSFQPGRHLTGPSLAGVVGRKAGTAEGYMRYSDALKKSDIVWDARQLDAWLTNPQALVPGNAMSFPGIGNAGTRADLIAYLDAVSSGRVKPTERALPDLKKADPDVVVTAITQCGDAYRVTTGDGKTETFWEFNLRFKTDGSSLGPAPGKPVLIGTGMQGDRAIVVFSKIGEISSFVRLRCP